MNNYTPQSRSWLPTTKSRLAGLACTGLITVGAVTAITPTAQAASSSSPTFAPYALVAGVINADGSIAQSKNIESVTRPQKGVYCVQTSLPDVAQTVPQVTSANGTIVASVSVKPTSTCGSKANTYTVYLWNSGSKDWFDGGFFISAT